MASSIPRLFECMYEWLKGFVLTVVSIYTATVSLCFLLSFISLSHLLNISNRINVIILWIHQDLKNSFLTLKNLIKKKKSQKFCYMSLYCLMPACPLCLKHNIIILFFFNTMLTLTHSSLHWSSCWLEKPDYWPRKKNVATTMLDKHIKLNLHITLCITYCECIIHHHSRLLNGPTPEDVWKSWTTQCNLSDPLSFQWSGCWSMIMIWTEEEERCSYYPSICSIDYS